MKTKMLGLILSGMVSITSFAQLKVTPNGYVGVGTNLPISTLHAHGTLFLTGNNNYFRFIPNNPGTEIGTSTDDITFWYSTTGFNALAAQQLFSYSDSTLKYDITPLRNSLDLVLQLKGYSYYSNVGPDNATPRRFYGFISQEVRELMPHATDSCKGYLMMDYSQIIPLTVEAIKAQQLTIDSLKMLVGMSQGKSLGQQQGGGEAGETSAVLFQNTPNPFTQETEIAFRIPEPGFREAEILLFDMSGTLLKSYPVQAGKGSVKITGGELHAGMYIYALLVNGKEIDSKRMILLGE